MFSFRSIFQAAAPLALLGLAACDYSGDWLFAETTELVPGVVHLGELTPADVSDLSDVQASTVYGEVGATGTTALGGVTFSFEGTGASVCVWVDPELVSWSQSVAAQQPNPSYSFPDNLYDDGDLDLEAGFSVYYNGSPGEEAGSFQVFYEDSLGNKVPIELNECVIRSMREDDGGHSGRSSPEYCDFTTQPDVRYTVLMSTWSTPLDDNRLSYGVVLANGSCSSVQTVANHPECVIVGEAIQPTDRHDYREDPILAVGLENVQDLTWPGSINFEGVFCATANNEADDGERLSDYCTEEAELKDCAVEHCFCGDPTDTPTGGAF